MKFATLLLLSLAICSAFAEGLRRIHKNSPRHHHHNHDDAYYYDSEGNSYSCPAIANNNPYDPIQVTLVIQSLDSQSLDALAEITPIVEAFGNGMKLQIQFLADADANFVYSDDPSTAFTSANGKEEVLADLFEICALNLYPLDSQLLEYFTCIANPSYDVINNLITCANSPISYNDLLSCYNTRSVNLLNNNIMQTNYLNVNSAPIVFVNSQICNSELRDCICQTAGASSYAPPEYHHSHFNLVLSGLVVVVAVGILIGIAIAIGRRLRARRAGQEAIPEGYTPLQEIPQPVMPNMYAGQIIVVPFNPMREPVDDVPQEVVM